jgi:hypothetical protein
LNVSGRIDGCIDLVRQDAIGKIAALFEGELVEESIQYLLDVLSNFVSHIHVLSGPDLATVIHAFFIIASSDEVKAFHANAIIGLTRIIAGAPEHALDFVTPRFVQILQEKAVAGLDSLSIAAVELLYTVFGTEWPQLVLPSLSWGWICEAWERTCEKAQQILCRMGFLIMAIVDAVGQGFESGFVAHMVDGLLVGNYELRMAIVESFASAFSAAPAEFTQLLSTAEIFAVLDALMATGGSVQPVLQLYISIFDVRLRETRDDFGAIDIENLRGHIDGLFEDDKLGPFVRQIDEQLIALFP